MLGIGGALFGVLLQPLWANFISPKSRLYVTISPHSFKTPRFLRNGIDEYRLNYKMNIRPTEQAKEDLYWISRAGGHFEVTIRNPSKRSIAGLSIRLSDSSSFFADRDSEEIQTFSGKLLGLGDLDPESTIKVHVWTQSDVPSYRFLDPRDLIIVRANSYDHIETKLELPQHVKSQYISIPRKVAEGVFFAFWLACLAAAATFVFFSITERKQDPSDAAAATSHVQNQRLADPDVVAD